jgi:hypothetical protein
LKLLKLKSWMERNPIFSSESKASPPKQKDRMAPKGTLSRHAADRIWLPGAGRSDVEVPVVSSGRLQVQPGTRRKTAMLKRFGEFFKRCNWFAIFSPTFDEQRVLVHAANPFALAATSCLLNFRVMLAYVFINSRWRP